MSNNEVRPPWLAAILIRVASPPGVRGEAVWGDLLEEFRAHADARGTRSARWWYYRQTIGVLLRYCVGLRFRWRTVWRRTRVEHDPHQGLARLARSDRHRGEVWNVDRSSTFEEWIADARYGIRILLRKPGFAVTVVLVLGVGAGSAAALGSAAGALYWKPLPFPGANRLLALTQFAPDGRDLGFSLPDFQEWSERSTAFSRMAAHDGAVATVRGVGGGLDRIEGAEVTAGFFETLRVGPVMGRAIAEADDRLGAEPVVVVSHDYWTQRLGADLEIVGRTVMLSEAPHVVIGVMPPGFRFPGASYFWIPVGTIEEFRDPENYDLRGIARMSEGLDLNSARVEGEYIVQRLAAAFPSTKTGLRTGVRYLRDEMVPVELVRSSLALVLGVLFFVVLACSNLGHLAVVRALGRADEFHLRYRLGASRSRLARQLAAEAIVLATAAAALAALVAIWVQRLIGGLIPDDLASALSVVVAEPALGAGGASVAAVLWILIALLAGWVGLQARGSLAGGSHGSKVTRRSQAFRTVTITVQTGAAFMLLVAAGLMLRTSRNLLAVDLGFDPEDKMTVLYTMPGSEFEERDRRRAVNRAVLDKMGSIEEIRSVGATLRLPVAGDKIEFAYRPEGIALSAFGPLPVATFNGAAPGYFEAMGIPLLEGRGIGSDDGPDNPVAVVSESLARRWWPAGTAVGRGVRLGTSRTAVDDTSPLLTVVGVVGDLRHDGARDRPDLAIYVPYTQFPAFYFTIVVAPLGGWPRNELASRLRDEIRSVAPGLLIVRIAWMEDLIRDSFVQTRTLTAMLLIFAVLAFAIATIGMYGTVSFLVQQMRREIGIRVAIGAAPQTIVRWVATNGITPCVFGISLGVVAAAVASSFFENLLFGVVSSDPATYAMSAVLILTAAASAALAPAVRASRTPPRLALQAE